jgi:putative endonuclease
VAEDPTQPAPPSAPPTATTNQRGRAAEDRAARLLEASGLRVVARNVVAGGVELDLIAESSAGGERLMVFVEVRSRQSGALGDPLATISAMKSRRIVRGATAYLVERELWGRVAVRFDVIGVLGGGAPDDPDTPELTWICGAFDAR